MHSGTTILGRDLVAALYMQILNGHITSATESTANQPLQVTARGTHNAAQRDLFRYRQLLTHCDSRQANVAPLAFFNERCYLTGAAKLIKLDSIQPIKSSQWISPNAETMKKNRGICLCVDLREL